MTDINIEEMIAKADLSDRQDRNELADALDDAGRPEDAERERKLADAIESATDNDFAALCAAIDAEDYLALFPLADLLEERGDQRAEGLRTIRHEPRFVDSCWAWTAEVGEVWNHLSSEDCKTRSAAYLALAEALAREPAAT